MGPDRTRAHLAPGSPLLFGSAPTMRHRPPAQFGPVRPGPALPLCPAPPARPRPSSSSRALRSARPRPPAPVRIAPPLLPEPRYPVLPAPPFPSAPPLPLGPLPPARPHPPPFGPPAPPLGHASLGHASPAPPCPPDPPAPPPARPVPPGWSLSPVQPGAARPAPLGGVFTPGACVASGRAQVRLGMLGPRNRPAGEAGCGRLRGRVPAGCSLGSGGRGGRGDPVSVTAPPSGTGDRRTRLGAVPRYPRPAPGRCGRGGPRWRPEGG
ncbi:PREDICTED: proline-rich protein 2-like [Capra hircus]|uniref:proline-rich protein 2-like n=1 Tax=Capra hircus TaxID=9925 RepID=UPI0008469910|nr:PREDICTED: proline-rich protein 2-like [Capra hircus]